MDADFTPEPGARVEWRNGSGGDVSAGTVIRYDNGLGGPWWLVDVDGEVRLSLVKARAVYPPGGIRLEQTADAIHHVLRKQAHRCHGAGPFPSWSDALEIAEAVIALGKEGGPS
jgi:hypothetical protein